MKRTLSLIAICMCSILFINAQTTEGLKGFQLHAGVSFPMGDFGSGDIKKDDMDGKKGFAGTGFNFGAKYYVPISAVNNLSAVVDLDFYYNGLNGDAKDAFDEIEKEEGLDIKKPTYLNIPLTVGINYAYPINSNLDIYGEAVVGVNYSKMTNYKMEGEEEYDGDIYKSTTKYDAAFGFTYGLEAGVMFNKRYSISLRYQGLGSYNYEGKDTFNVDGEEESEKFKKAFDKKKPMSNLTIAIGFKF